MVWKCHLYLPVCDVHRDHRVAEQVGALAIAAVGAADRRRQRQIEQPALLVEREVERPGVDAEAVLPAVAFPRVVTDLARLRHGVEFPQLRAGARIERARIADPADRRPAACSRRRRRRSCRRAAPSCTARPMSTSPSLPKPGSRAPVFALSAIRRRPAVKMMRGGTPPSPGQYATPRRDGAPPVTGCCQISLPVSGVERDDAIRGRQIHDAVDDDRRHLGIHAAGTAPPAGGGAGASLCRR